MTYEYLMKTDLSQLYGGELYAALSVRYDNPYHDYADLLMYALFDDREKAYKVLDKAVHNNWEFVAVYEGIGDKVISDMVILGGIMDGCLCIKVKDEETRAWLKDNGF